MILGQTREVLELVVLQTRYHAKVSQSRIMKLLKSGQKSIENQQSFYYCSSSAKNKVKLAEVGKFAAPKNGERYDTGQLFLHKIFGYRGVILFPWSVRVFDRDIFPKNEMTTDKLPHILLADSELNLKKNDKDAVGTMESYYQALIDIRDCPFVRAQSQTEAVTFLGNQDNGRTLYAVPGLDYVAHEDIMPYTAHDRKPIRHDLFEKFLVFSSEKDPPYHANSSLKAWQERNNCWLGLSDVHKEITEQIRVTVIPFYIGCRLSQNNNIYWWRYCIRLENLGSMNVHLRERHWRIFSLSGTLETVRGRGVIGQEPSLSKENPAFQYSSHVSLQAPSGHMWGTFRMEREDGYMFDCRIPPFSLESKSEAANVPTDVV